MVRKVRGDVCLVYVKVCLASWARETEASLLASGFISGRGGGIVGESERGQMRSDSRRAIGSGPGTIKEQ